MGLILTAGLPNKMLVGEEEPEDEDAEAVG